jgi:amino acid permease
MGLKVYLPVAVVSFLGATTGSDLYARTTIAGQALAVALQEHLYWAAVQFVATLLLLAPFVAVALLCDRAEKEVRTRSVLLIFAVAMIALLYFYFQGHQAAQRAELERMWTAATLSIGLLPFFIGVPVVLAVLGAWALAAKFDPRTSD